MKYNPKEKSSSLSDFLFFFLLNFYVQSPEASSLPSLCSPNGSLQDDELAFMTMNMEDDIDLSMRAPYISMSEADDLPLLISEDLMWGAFPEGLNLHKDMKEGMPKEASNGNVTNYSHPSQIPMSQHQQKMRCRDSQQLSQDHQLIDNCTNIRGSDQTDRGGGGDGCNIGPNDIINSCPDVFSKNSKSFFHISSQNLFSL